MFKKTTRRGLDKLQKISATLMAALILLTFVGANLHAILWQSSEWLVSTVLPSVVVDLTNEERADNAAMPLKRNAVLDEAARMKAKHMAKNEYFSHFSPDGVSPWHWFDQAGYVYAHAGENLAIHFTDSSEVVEAWMDSPTHRQNIVSNLYTEIGVGTYKGEFDGYETVYVVQLFGTPAVVDDIPESLAEVTIEPEAVELAVAETATPLPEVVDIVAEKTVSEVVPEQVEVPPVLVEVEPDETADSVTGSESLESDVVYVATTPEGEEVVVMEAPVIATSSGLVAAQVSHTPESHAGATLSSFMTQPNTMLQLVYLALSVLIVSMLGVSIVQEARRLHFEQVAYGFVLLIGMGGLWYAHSLLTTGAIIA
tara:strand:+ start:7994 stop:9100 length:1107 start_codon:yes stop_codon:yes gene_type:complete